MNNPIKRWFPIFVIPTLVAFLISFVIPFISGILLSFTEFRTVSDAQFVGISNYIKAFTQDSTFLSSLWFTVRFALVSVASINIFAFLLALMLTRTVPATKLFRTVFFMPNLIGGIVLGYIWQVIINGVLYRFNYSITSNSAFGFWGLVIMMNWQMIGYVMIIYIAGIQNIPNDIIEASRVDGAGPFTTLFRVIIPSVMPSITICLFLTITNSFKMFDQNLSLTAGAPANRTQMVALDIYNTFYSRTGYEGVGQAKAVIFFLIVAIIAFVQLRITGKKEEEA
ncbi:MAG: sugar ABC transporter permease [Ruminococcaceae bacterium]|nr:sugar ABC transporter permease [Oscillospiraceae bacterium]